MHQILVYGDSLSWGIIPDTRQRFAFHQRWPGVLEMELIALGASVRVIEDCLNGRRTDWHDPIKAGRRGIEGIEQRIEVNSPLSLVILFLGSNDFQSMHQNSARDSARGLQSIVAAIRNAPIEPGMPVPDIMLVAPPELQKANGSIAQKFEGAEIKAIGLAAEIEKVAVEERCFYFNAGSVTLASLVDGVHLDEDQQLKLGKALAKAVLPLLLRGRTSLTTRPIQAGDLSSVSALGIASKVSWGYKEEAMDVFDKELTVSGVDLDELLAAEIALKGDEIVGYFTIRKHEAGMIELDHLFVSTKHFREGIGSRLLERAIEVARQNGASSLTVVSDPNAAEFYERFGALKVGDHKSSIAGRTLPIYEISTR